jgi:hypothetical protein
MLAWTRPRRTALDATGAVASPEKTHRPEPGREAASSTTVDIALEPTASDLPQPCGWLDSSLELARGLLVIEHPGGVLWPAAAESNTNSETNDDPPASARTAAG